jgi:hypothetical protein
VESVGGFEFWVHHGSIAESCRGREERDENDCRGVLGNKKIDAHTII